jgi:hypothetical protein
VPPRAGTFVINIGELLELASDGYLRATMRRVVSPPAGARHPGTRSRKGSVEPHVPRGGTELLEGAAVEYWIYNQSLEPLMDGGISPPHHDVHPTQTPAYAWTDLSNAHDGQGIRKTFPQKRPTSRQTLNTMPSGAGTMRKGHFI